MTHAHPSGFAQPAPGCRLSRRRGTAPALGRLLVLTLALAVPAGGFAAIGADHLAAQSASRADTGRDGRSLVMALPDDFPATDAVSMLVRTPELDVVVLQAGDLTAEAAAMALSLLRDIAERDPVPAGGSAIPITGYSMLEPLSDADRARLEKALVRLERAPVTRVGDLGPGRWIRLEG